MKIVHKLKTGVVGGTETHALTLSLAQREAGHDVAVLVFAQRGAISDLMEAKGLPVYYADSKSECDFRGALRARKILKQLEPDVIHSHGMEWVSFLTTGHLHTARVNTAHCYPAVAAKSGLFRKGLSLLNRWCLRFTDGYIAVTEDVRIKYAERKLFHYCPWKVIHNGIDLKKFVPDEGFSLPAKESGQPIELLMVGRMESEKHPHDAIRTLALLRDRHGLDARLTFCGDGSVVPRCEELAKELGVAESVTFAGRCANVEEYMRRSHGLFLLSDVETFAQAALEAIATGCPVFAYRIPGGFQEWFKDEGSGGVISDQRTPESLAKTIMPVLSDPKRWTQMRIDAIRTAQDFSATVMAEKTIAFYQELLS